MAANPNPSTGNTQVCFTIDAELLQAVRAYESAYGISFAAAVRNLLRHATGIVPSQPDAGWREGFNAAVMMVREMVTRAIQATPAFDPSAFSQQPRALQEAWGAPQSQEQDAAAPQTIPPYDPFYTGG